jgi:hypothetical protein
MNTPPRQTHWQGPFGWPNFESALPPAPSLPGTYLQTFEYQDGYLIYAAGITRRTVRSRLHEHTKQYLSGVYTVLDVDAVQAGTRKEIWHGFWMKPRPTERVAEFHARHDEIITSARRQLASFRIFVAEMKEPRILERLEAAVMSHLYQQASPFCDIPDKGMFLAPRLSSEESIIVNNTCDHILHTLPLQLEI